MEDKRGYLLRHVVTRKYRREGGVGFVGPLVGNDLNIKMD